MPIHTSALLRYQMLPVSLPPALIPLVLAIPQPLRHVQFPLTSFSFCHDFIFFCQGLVKFGHQTRQLFLQILANRAPNKVTNVAPQIYKISRFKLTVTPVSDAPSPWQSLLCAFRWPFPGSQQHPAKQIQRNRNMTRSRHSHPPLRTCRPMILKGLELDSPN